MKVVAALLGFSLICTAQARAGSLDETLARAKRLTDEARAKQGWPPASDYTGTILECDRRIKRGHEAFARCAGERAKRLAASSREDAGTVAAAVVAGCPAEREALVRAAYPYCIAERADAEGATDRFVQSVERDMLALIVEARRRATPPPPIRQETPAGSL